MDRINRDDFYFELVHLVAKRGTCNRAQVGCILVNDKNRVVAMGYNSSHKNTPHCTDKGCLIEDDHCLRCLHAEQAAVLNLEHEYEDLTAYVTHYPCIHCYKILTAANVHKIITYRRYGHDTEVYKHLRFEVGVDIKGYFRVGDNV